MEEAEKSHSPNQLKTEKQHESTTSQPATAVNERVPQRFVHMHRMQDGHVHLSAEMVVDKKAAAFKLKYPHRIKSHQTLSKSQWLPEAALGSEPYFIYRRGASFQRKGAILSVGKDTDGKYVGTCGDHSDNIEQQLFVLKLGHKT